MKDRVEATTKNSRDYRDQTITSAEVTPNDSLRIKSREIEHVLNLGLGPIVLWPEFFGGTNLMQL